jgi:NTE family protein
MMHEGAHTGDYLAEWLGPVLEAVGVRTFGDLRLSDSNSSLQPYQTYSLVVQVSDLTRRVLVRLPWDYGQYNLDPDRQPVVDAVRASMSMPFYFRPVQVTTPKDGAVTWVDGGLLADFPMTVFDRTDGRQQRWPTWGIKLTGRPVLERDRPVRTAVGIAVTCVETLLADWNRYRLDDEGVNARTIYVDTTEVAAFNFDLTRNDQEALFRNGQDAGARFLRQQPDS